MSVVTQYTDVAINTGKMACKVHCSPFAAEAAVKKEDGSLEQPHEEVAAKEAHREGCGSENSQDGEL